MEDTILYSSCFDANGGLFETLLSQRTRHKRRAQHASIIDGCGCARHSGTVTTTTTWPILTVPQGGCIRPHRLIATDGVFSMDGVIANLKGICDG
jgi:glycine C-acetyltransferase